MSLGLFYSPLIRSSVLDVLRIGTQIKRQEKLRKNR